MNSPQRCAGNGIWNQPKGTASRLLPLCLLKSCLVSLFSILLNQGELFGEMRMTTAELTAEILKLPSEEIVQVVEALLNRINPVSAEVDEVWGQEVERRVDAFEKGEISAIDGDFAMRSLKDRLKD